MKENYNGKRRNTYTVRYVIKLWVLGINDNVVQCSLKDHKLNMFYSSSSDALSGTDISNYDSPILSVI